MKLVLEGQDHSDWTPYRHVIGRTAIVAASGLAAELPWQIKSIAHSYLCSASDYFACLKTRRS